MFDNERIIEAIWGKVQYYPEIKHLGKKICRNGMIAAMESGLAVVVTITGKTRSDRKKMLDLVPEGFQTKIIVCMAKADECARRCKDDPTRPKSTSWEPIINNWFKSYEPVTYDEAGSHEVIESSGDNYGRG